MARRYSQSRHIGRLWGRRDRDGVRVGVEGRGPWVALEGGTMPDAGHDREGGPEAEPLFLLLA